MKTYSLTDHYFGFVVPIVPGKKEMSTGLDKWSTIAPLFDLSRGHLGPYPGSSAVATRHFVCACFASSCRITWQHGDSARSLEQQQQRFSCGVIVLCSMLSSSPPTVSLINTFRRRLPQARSPFAGTLPPSAVRYAFRLTI